MVEFYLLTFPRFPLRKKEHKSYFGKNRTHDFRTSRCADYLLDYSGDEGKYLHRQAPSGQSRVYKVTQLCADGVHHRESAGTGPVIVLKVTPVTGARWLTMDKFGCASLS